MPYFRRLIYRDADELLLDDDDDDARLLLLLFFRCLRLSDAGIEVELLLRLLFSSSSDDDDELLDVDRLLFFLFDPILHVCQ